MAMRVRLRDRYAVARLLNYGLVAATGTAAAILNWCVTACWCSVAFYKTVGQPTVHCLRARASFYRGSDGRSLGTSRLWVPSAFSSSTSSGGAGFSATVLASVVAVAARVVLGPRSGGAGRRGHGGQGLSSPQVPTTGRSAAPHDASAAVTVHPERAREWLKQLVEISAVGVLLWTALDCLLDPGIEYPWGVFRIAFPTALLVAPGAAVLACARLEPRPCGGLEQFLGKSENGARRSCCAVFLGDSLTHGSLSANFLEVLATRHGVEGLVNVGMNMRPSADLLKGTLLEDAAGLAPSLGVIVLIGTNDLIRYTLLPKYLRRPEAEWLSNYAANLREMVRRLRAAGSQVTLASPPPLGEVLTSEEGRLGTAMAEQVRQVAAGGDCRYAPLHEAVVGHLTAAAASGTLAPRSRAYSAAESFSLLCALPWRLYGGRVPLATLQAEQGLELTVDLVHYGPCFADIAAAIFAETLGL